MPKPPPRNPSAPRKEQNRVPRAPRNLAPAEPREAERVAKVIARAGLGSRREIEDWIGEGRVTVNGEVLDTPARTVTPEDAITVDGRPLPAKERTRLFLYHKPKGVVTTNFDPEGRPTLFEILPADLPRLVSVGRLDLNTEGLILLTNDGGLSRVLELPETGWLRRYRVRAKGEITQDKLDALINGITVDGVHYGPIEAVLDRVQGANSWLTLALREGKNREVRNVLGSLGLDVNRLIRLSYGPFQLGEIAQGAVEEVRTRVLADQLGPELTAAAGADFDGPLFVYDGSDEEAPRAPARSGKAARYAKAEGAEDRHRRKPIDTEETPERTVKAGIVADRKGRKVLVQRVKSNAPEPEPERAPLRGRRSEGDRPFRQREDGDRPARAPRREGEGGERTFRSRGERPEGDRPFRQRADGDRPARAPRREGEGGERTFRSRGERPEGDRPFRQREDGDRPARAPRREEGGQPFRARTERPRREEEGGERTFRPRSERPEGERPFRKREDGDRPARGPRREGDERPARAPRREEGERTERAFRPRTPREEAAAARPFRTRSDEGGFRKREDGERPSRPRPPREEGERGERPFRPRTERAEGERPFRPRSERPEGDRPFRNRDGEERPARAPRREQGERPFRERSFRGEGSNRPYSGRVKSEEAGRGRSFRSGEGAERRDSRPEGKIFGAKNLGDKGAARDKPRGERSFGDKPGGRPAGKFAGKPGGGKSFGGKPGGGRPGGGKPGGGKPRGERPSGGPSKPRGPRPPRS